VQVHAAGFGATSRGRKCPRTNVYRTRAMKCSGWDLTLPPHPAAAALNRLIHCSACITPQYQRERPAFGLDRPPVDSTTRSVEPKPDGILETMTATVSAGNPLVYENAFNGYGQSTIFATSPGGISLDVIVDLVVATDYDPVRFQSRRNRHSCLRIPATGRPSLLT